MILDALKSQIWIHSICFIHGTGLSESLSWPVIERHGWSCKTSLRPVFPFNTLYPAEASTAAS